MDNQNTMPQGNPNPTPAPTGAPIPPQGEERKSVGALIGSIIIVIILIIGGFYLWSTKVAPTDAPMMDQGMPVMDGNVEEMTVEEQALNQPDPALSQMAAVVTSDEVADIDSDLKTTNLDGMDSGLQ